MNTFELINVLNSFVNGTELKEPVTDWANILSLAKQQSVAGMMYPIIEKQADIETLDKAICAAFESEYFNTITRMSKFEFVKDKISKCFESEKIQCVFFKGSVIKDCYPIPELRTMGDIDILIYDCDREKVDKVLQSLGAVCKRNIEPVWSYILSGVMLEVHTKFAEDVCNTKPKAADAYKYIWENCEKLSGYEYIYIPTAQFHIIMLIIHTYYHFAGVGCGIRLFIDVGLFYEKNKDKIDTEKLKEDIKKYDLENFNKLTFYLNHKWFGFENIYDTVYDEQTYIEVTDFILQSGTFGEQKGTNAHKSARKELNNKTGIRKLFGKIKFFIKKLLPPFKVMKLNYKFVEKCPILLPIAWIINIFRQLKTRRKYLTNYTKDLFSNDPEAEKIYKLFNKIEI